MLRSDIETLHRKIMARFVNEEVIPVAREIDEKGDFPFYLFQKLADMGILGIRYPRKRGAPAATPPSTASPWKNWQGGC